MLKCECGLNCQTSTNVFATLVAAGAGRFSGDHMDDVIPMIAKIPQEGGHHGSRLKLGVVEQDNSATYGVEPVGDQLQFLIWRHFIPVASPKIGAKHDNSARLQ